MSFFGRDRPSAQDGSNGRVGDKPADNDREPLLEQGELPTGGDSLSDGLDAETKSRGNWALGFGVVKDALDFIRLTRRHREGVISTRTEEVMAFLEEIAEEVETVPSTDAIVNAAFGQRQILTKGSADAANDDYKAFWTEHLEREAKKNDPKGLSGWGERVTLKAYRILIKDAAAPLREGILTTLLRKEENGVPSDKIWEFLSVRATVQHKWDLWAAKWLFLESICFLGWILSFVCFLLAYLADDMSEDYDTMDPNERGEAFIAYIADASSVIFMSPFLVKAFKAVAYYGWARLQMWSIIDLCCYVLQLLISVFHYYHFFFDGNIYTSLLAVHCVLLFVKVQYYGRVLEVGAAYVESLKILMIAVRGLLLFIVLTAISAALSFATLYKWDIHKSLHKSNDELEGFSSFPRAVITTFSVLLGNFQPAYVFDTENRIVKGIFFVVFEAIISIAVLNLMIAVMTQTYAWILSRGLAVHSRCRAETIDRLEVTLPHFFHHKYEPYIHFLVREEDEKIGTLFTQRSQSANNVSTLELQKQMKDLQESMKKLHENMDYIISRLNELTGSSSSFRR